MVLEKKINSICKILGLIPIINCEKLVQLHNHKTNYINKWVIKGLLQYIEHDAFQ